MNYPPTVFDQRNSQQASADALLKQLAGQLKAGDLQTAFDKMIAKMQEN